MIQTYQSTNGTSFHDSAFRATLESLRKIFGDPQYIQNNGEDKVNFCWDMETSKGTVFTVYDWKEYRPLRENEIVEWHIGGEDRTATEEALEEIITALNNLEE